MSASDKCANVSNEKRIRFRPAARVLFNSEGKIEDLLKNDKVDMSADDTLKKGRLSFYQGLAKNMLKIKFLEKRPSLFSFLQVELTRGYALEHDEERYSARREKIYSFMKIPREVEKFMIYGFMQCTDSFLFVYTFLPLRVLLALWTLMTRPFAKCFG